MTDSAEEVSSQRVASGLEDYEFAAVSLVSLNMELADPTATPGSWTWETHYQTASEGDQIAFRVHNMVEIREGEPEGAEGSSDTPPDDIEEDAHIARIVCVHQIGFLKNKEPSEDDRQSLLRLARMAAHPLFREKVLSLTADMGFPPLVIPILHGPSMPEAYSLD